MSTCADTSLLVSIYSLDANSKAAALHWKSLPLPLLLTPFGATELEVAFQLRVFRKDIVALEAAAAIALYRDDLRHQIYSLRPLPQDLWLTAQRLAKSSAVLGVRTLDILHVASALLPDATVFLTFDQRQRRLAAAEGLRVD